MSTSATMTPSVGLSYLRTKKSAWEYSRFSLAIAPDRRQHEIGEHVGERAVAENVIGRRALAVGEAAAAEEGKGGVDFSGKQQEHEDRAETAPAHRPLLEAHFLAAAGEKAEGERQQRGGGDEGQRAVHGSPSRLAGSAA